MKSITSHNPNCDRVVPNGRHRTLQSSGWLKIGLIICLAIGLETSKAIAQSSSPQPNFSAQSVDSDAATVLHVNPNTGDDMSADGSDLAPFKTITRALEVAQPNTTIQLAPGIYSTQTGESFPIALKPRVTLQGNAENRGQDVVIQGGGTFASPNLSRQNITILGGANQATLIGVTITNPNPEGYGIQVESSNPTVSNSTFTGNGRGGMIFVGTSTSLIRNNFFYQNGANGISIHGTARPTIQENIFEQTEVGILVDDNASPLIENNRITRNKTGVMVRSKGQPRLRNNSVENNEQFGLLAGANSKPDFATAGDNANFFRNNGKQDISTESTAANASEKPEAALPKKEASASKVTNPTPLPQQHSPASRPSTQNVVVPVVPIGSPSKAVPAESVPFGDRLPLTPAHPTPNPSIEKKSVTKATQPLDFKQSSTHSTTSISTEGLSSEGFPTPALLSNAKSDVQPARTMQVVQLEQSKTDLPLPSHAKPPAVVEINRAPMIKLTPRPLAQITATSRVPQPEKTAIAIKRPPIPIPPAVPTMPSDDIPAPPTVLRRVSPAKPNSAARSLSSIPARASSSHAIPIPVPPPETEQITPTSKTPTSQSVTSAAPLPNSANTQSATRLGSLLPVPSSNIPVGNIGDMPSVYAVGRLRQDNLTLDSKANPLVKYRVIVAATDHIQEDQIRTIAPNAFPVVYRGQRVMQAGAFGDRTKAEQLVTAFNNQGLQALVEPLK